MIGYARWKIVLVAVVMIIGVFLALPNIFGQESALQLAADRAAVTEADRTAVVQLLADKSITPTGVFLEQGRLTLRFATTTDQLKAPRCHCRSAAESIHHRAVAGFERSRMDARHRLESHQIGPRPTRRRLSGLSGRRARRREAAARPARARYSRVAAQCPHRLSGRGRRLWGQSRPRVISRRGYLCQGQSGHSRRQPQFNLHRYHGERHARARAAAHAAGNPRPPKFGGSTEYRHAAQSPQQPRTRRLRAAGSAGRRGSNRHSAAGTAKLGRGQKDSWQDRDVGISHGR